MSVVPGRRPAPGRGPGRPVRRAGRVDGAAAATYHLPGGDAGLPAAGRGVLLGGDDHHRRVRRLHLPAPGSVADGRRHRADAARRAFVAVFFALLTNVLVSRGSRSPLGRRRITGPVRARPGHRPRHGRPAGRPAAGRRGPRTWSRWTRARTTGICSQLRALGVPVVIADATQRQALESASLPGAAAVAVLTSDDLANLETGLAVRDQLGAGSPHARSCCASSTRGWPGRSGTTSVSPRPVHGRPGRPVVRRRGARPGGAQHLLRRRRAAAGGPVRGHPRRRPGRPGHERPVGPDPRAGHPPDQRRRLLEHPPRRGTRFRGGDRAYVIGPYEELLAVLRRDRPAPHASGLPGPSAQPR